MAQSPQDIFLGNTEQEGLDEIVLPDETPSPDEIILDDVFEGTSKPTDIGDFFLPKVLTPFTREPGDLDVTMSEEGKKFLLQEMSRSEAEKQSSYENFYNAGYKSLIPQSKAAYMELFGFHDEAVAVLEEANIEFPTREGASEFLGSILGGILPQAVALGATIATSGAAAPLSFAVFANYGLQAAGQGLGSVRAFEEQEGLDIHPATKAFVATGYGVAVFMSERLGLKWMRGAVDDLSAVALKEIAKAYSTGSARTVAKSFLRAVVKVPVGVGALEGIEESMEQIATNVIDKTYKSSAVFENVPEAALGGFVGGAFLGGLGGAARASTPSFRKGAIDGFPSKNLTAGVVEPLSSGLEQVNIETGEITPVDKLLENFERVNVDPELSIEDLRKKSQIKKDFIHEENKKIIDITEQDIQKELKPVEDMNALEVRVHEIKSFATDWAEKMVDVFDIETKYARVGLAKTGLAVKTMFSVRAVHESQGVDVIKDVVGSLGVSSKKYLNRIVTIAENISLLDDIPVSDRTQVTNAVAALRKYFDDSLTEYQKAGGLQQGFKQNLIDRLNKDIARAKSRKNASEVKLLMKDIEKAKDMEFVHIPYGIWFEDVIGRDNTRSRSLLRLLEKTPRKTILIQDLIDEGVIEAGDVKLADVIASYSRRKGFDLSLLNIVNAAKAEGAALELKREDKPQAGFVVAPSSAPVLKGYQIHPILAEFIAEVTSAPATLNNFRRFMNISKMSAFINPFFLPVYDAIQGAMLGTFSPLRPFKTMKYVIEGVDDVWNRTDEFYRARLAGLTSTPYDNPLSSARDEAQAATQLAGIFQFYLTKNFKASPEGIAKGVTFLPFSLFKLAYNLSWKIAWGLDGTVRQISWRFLTENKGMSDIDAAQKAALYHGDYASVPSGTRKQLNTIFFTPTFKVAMAKLYLTMINDAGKTIKGDPNVDTYENAKGLIRVLGILTAMDALMLSLGWERDEFGRKYTRLTETDEGLKELVITWSGPHNQFQKYITRWNDATQPQVTNPLESFFRANSWELHPNIRTAQGLISNKDRQGKEIVRVFMSYREKALRRAHFALSEVVALYRLVLTEGAEDPKATAAFRKEAGQLLEMAFSGFTFKYLRDAPDQRLERNIERIVNLVNKYAKNKDQPLSMEEVNNALGRIEEILDNYDEKASLMNEPFDIVDDETLEPNPVHHPEEDTLDSIDLE